MEWTQGKLNINLDVIVPSDGKYRDKFLTGVRILLLHKNTLLKSNDTNYFRFLELYKKVEQSTLLDFDRAYILFQAAQATKNLSGCSAECGVYRGGSSMLIAGINPARRHYALDTFEGFPDVISDVDMHEEDGFSDISFIEIQKMFSNFKNISVCKGKFSESFKNIKDELFSFVYIDADLYISTIECCDFFYPRLVKGGIILFDDYLVPDTPGVKKAVDEFFSGKDEIPIILQTCQAMLFKL